MKRRPPSALSLLSLAALACGRPDPAQRSHDAFRRGDYGLALECLDEILGGMDPAHPDHDVFAVARCRALAHLDAGRTVAAAESLRAASAEDYGRIALELEGVGELLASCQVLALGFRAHSGDRELGARWRRILDEVMEGPDTDEAERLRELFRQEGLAPREHENRLPQQPYPALFSRPVG